MIVFNKNNEPQYKSSTAIKAKIGQESTPYPI
jgi:hypothetical protein